MTTVDRVAPPPMPGPNRIGQATAIEQSRAVAEVHAAIVVAQQCPRNVQAAIREMRDSCGRTALAERAFFKFSRGQGSVSGPSIHLARDLARAWGNIQYGIAELSRDDEHGQSEMLAYAWDVQTNTRVSNVFIVPHKRDKRGGPERLSDMRDIYENNANNGARRVREAIFGVLPPWFVDEAKDRCMSTLTEGGGKPLPQRIADAVKAFEGIGIVADQLEQKIGRPTAKWLDLDVAQLGITFKSIQRGEISKDEEFPPQRVTVDEIAATATPEPEQPAKARAKKATAPAEEWPEVPQIPDGPA